jgi:hypothetical protein
VPRPAGAEFATARCAYLIAAYLIAEALLDGQFPYAPAIPGGQVAWADAITKPVATAMRYRNRSGQARRCMRSVPSSA